jgi:hypothetical protein
MLQHLSPQATVEKPQHRLLLGMQVESRLSQQALPQARSGLQQTPLPRQISPTGQHLLPQGGRSAGQHRLAEAMQLSVGSQHVLPQMFSGSQQVPALGPVLMQV